MHVATAHIVFLIAMQFHLLADYSLETVPQLTDPVLKLFVLSCSTFAMQTYLGLSFSKNSAINRERLRHAQDRTVSINHPPASKATYNRKFTPISARRNRAIIKNKKKFCVFR